MVKSTISKDEVKHIAKLARLGLSEKEIKKMQKEMAVILDYIDLLQEVNVSDVKPTSHTVPLANVKREDVIREETPGVINDIVKQAPDRERNYVRVKGIL